MATFRSFKRFNDTTMVFVFVSRFVYLIKRKHDVNRDQDRSDQIRLAECCREGQPCAIGITSHNFSVDAPRLLLLAVRIRYHVRGCLSSSPSAGSDPVLGGALH